MTRLVCETLHAVTHSTMVRFRVPSSKMVVGGRGGHGDHCLHSQSEVTSANEANPELPRANKQQKRSSSSICERDSGWSEQGWHRASGVRTQPFPQGNACPAHCTAQRSAAQDRSLSNRIELEVWERLWAVPCVSYYRKVSEVRGM